MSLAASHTHHNHTSESSNSAHGNRASRTPFFKKQEQSFFRPVTHIQPKLTVNAPNDIYEKEADEMADRVMRMPDPQIQRQEEEEEVMMKPQFPVVQRKCAECEAEENLQRKASAGTITPFFQRKEAGGREVNQQTAASLQSRKGGGKSLPEHTRSWMESRFGADFSRVKVHTGSKAVQLNRELNAKAFTHGSDIYFNRGEFAPGTSDGKRLLAHELTHVVQQTGHSGSGSNVQRSFIRQHLTTPHIQRKWRLDRVRPDEGLEVAYTSGNGSVLSYPVGNDTGMLGAVFGSAKTWQETGFIHQQVGGQAQVARWITKHYIFKNDGADSDFLQIRVDGQLAGNAKSEDLYYARAGAVVWGRVIERTAANPTPPDQELFMIKEGGISAAKVGELGVIEVEIPIGERGSAKITMPLKKVDEGEYAPFSGSRNLLHDVPGSVDEVDVLLGARVEGDADIETAFTGLAPWISRNFNNSRAIGNFILNWESRPAPGAESGREEDEEVEILVKRRCWSKRNCRGKAYNQKFAHCHNCKNYASGKSLGDPGDCENC